MQPSFTTLSLCPPLAAVPWNTVAIAIGAAAILGLLALYAVGALRRGPGAHVGQRITRAGIVYILLTMAVAIVALNTKVNFLVLLFGMLLSGLVLSFVLSRLTMRRLAFERVLPDGVPAGAPFTVELRATNRSRRRSSYGLAVRDALPEGLDSALPGGVALELRPGHTASLSYTATAARRGVYRFASLTYSTRFPFGLFHQGRARPLPGELLVYPQMGEVSPELLGRAQALALAHAHSHGTRGDEEFRNLREYRYGDNPRRIHWKTSAKLGTLLVKEHEAIVSERAFLVLDTRCPASGDAPLEAAVSFAASLARDLMLRGFFVSLAAYAPGLVLTPPTRGRPGLRSLLETLARLEPNPGHSLADLAGEPSVRAAERVLTVVALRHSDDDAAAALDLLGRRHPRVIAVDASAPSFGDLFQLRHESVAPSEDSADGEPRSPRTR